MDDLKRILVFSDAGGTGRSYHAELSARNRRLRVHYLLEPGWKADAAIQGLGRTNRTNQAQPPLFRPIATDVKAEKRFLSTIARRLDTLGAITRGQRQTGGQGLFRPEDNLESPYARDALRQLYLLLVRGKIEGCSLQMFEDATGLKLMDANGIKDELPPITTFLNRLLALTIELQGVLFTAFEQLLNAKIEGAIASGVYDVGLETLRAESFVVTDRRTIYTHPATGAETRLLTITERRRNRPVTLDEALDHLADARAQAAGQRALGPRRRADPGAEPHARRWRDRTPRPADPADGAPSCLAEDDGRKPLAGGRSARPSPPPGTANLPRCRSSPTARSISSPACCCRSGSACPNELTRVYRLQTDDGRAHHRPPGLARLGGQCHRDRARHPDAGRRLRGADRWPDHPRPGRGPSASPGARHGRQPHRAVRLHRHDARAPARLRPLQRDHLVEAALLRADRCQRRRRFWRKLLDTYPVERIAEREAA